MKLSVFSYLLSTHTNSALDQLSHVCFGVCYIFLSLFFIIVFRFPFSIIWRRYQCIFVINCCLSVLFVKYNNVIKFDNKTVVKAHSEQKYKVFDHRVHCIVYTKHHRSVCVAVQWPNWRLYNLQFYHTHSHNSLLYAVYTMFCVLPTPNFYSQYGF